MNCVPKRSAWRRKISIISGPWMPFSKPGIIFDLGGDGELAARLCTFDQHRREVGARGVERGGEARGSRTEDQNAMSICLPYFLCEVRTASAPAGPINFSVSLLYIRRGST